MQRAAGSILAAVADTRRMRLGMLIFCALGLAVLGGCAESENAQQSCRVTSDCSADGNVCHRGICVHVSEPRACTTPSECMPGEMCSAGFCGSPTVTDVVEDTTQPDVLEDTTAPDTTAPDTVADTSMPDLIDTIAPTITARSPEPDAKDVAVDTTVTVTFSEPLITATVNDANIRVADSSGRVAPATVTWDEDSLTATVTFNEPLAPWTRYEVTVSASVLDRAQIPVVETRWRFDTRAPEGLDAQEALARAYAPLLYLDASDRKRDLPVAIDFDNNLVTSDNPNKIGNAANPVPTVYYSWSSTESHHFLHYVLYFPTFKLASSSPTQDHAVVAALVVVAKTDGDPLGKLEFFETYSLGDNPGRIDTFLPQCTSESTEPFCPLAFSGRGAVIDRFHDVPAAEYADLDGRRVRLYVHPDDHELCHWTYENTGSGYCGRTGSTFLRADNAILTAAESGATAAVDWASHNGTYRLVHIGDPWWTQRSSVGSDSSNFYRDSALYVAPVTAIGGGGNLRVPTTLNTVNTSGNTGYFTPWGMRTNDGFGLEQGAWFVDPARAVQTRLNVPDGFEYRSNRVCYNLWANIDRTGLAVCQ